MTRSVPKWPVPVMGSCIVLAAAAVCLSSHAQSSNQAQPPGADKTAKTRVLEVGTKVLQGNAPVAKMDIYLNGFHPMKDHPEHQMEAHHFCHQMNQDFAQCALFDGSGPQANLNGVEYIISEKLFATLPDAEKKYWHPHNSEILSGQLIAPGIPQVAEKALMKDKMNSYGKTWHVWNTGMFGAVADKLPYGEPMLAWSFNRDGEAMPAMVEQRDKRLGVSSADKRSDRADLRSLARPQSGVDDLKGAFPRPTKDIPGVVDVRVAGPRHVPRAAHAEPARLVKVTARIAVTNKIDGTTAARLGACAAADPGTLATGLDALDREWDTERLLEAEAASMGLLGLALGVLVHPRLLVPPAFVAGSVLVHALTGRYPLMPAFLRAGVRTSREVARKRYALKALRGDFGSTPAGSAST